MRKMRILLSVILLTAAAGICRADITDDLVKENARLKQRVDKLEKELAELKRMVMQQAETPKGELKHATKPKPAAAPKLDESDLRKIAAMVQKDTAKKKAVWSNSDIQLYGYLKLDAAYDTSRMNAGNFARWVESERLDKDDEEFNMTANETRLGMRISGPQNHEAKTSGRVEIDFFEGGAENKARIMMRHAYMKIDWPEDRFSIIAGQTSDVISPLNPYTLNYSVAWWAGNIGYRRPQIRLTKSFAVNNDIDLKLEAAVTRTIGISNSFVPGLETGEDAGFPGIQGRASATFPLLKYKPTTFGVSGHWAQEELDTTISGASRDFDSWSVNLDLMQPINKWLTVKGELFTGENLSAYLGGIGQGVNTARFKEIGSRGGWVAANLHPRNKWSFNVGISIDDVDNDDLTGITGDKREFNRSIFGNVLYSINMNTQIGFELSQWHTVYVGEQDADSLRAQTSFIYKF